MKLPDTRLSIPTLLTDISGYLDTSEYLQLSYADRYRFLGQESARYGETNDCTVISAAMVLDLDYNQAHTLLHSLGRVARRGFNSMLLEARLLDRGGKAVFPKQANGSAYTVKTITELLPVGKYLVYTSGHVLACINGTIYDWTEDRKHRIKYYVEIDSLFGLL